VSVRAGYAACWPPAFGWDQPAAYDESGAACYATVDYLRARFGEPGEEPAPDAEPADAALDELLAELGYERVNE
jgi:hypothetical protein